ncbi:MAG TPA: hypothetical protein VLU92_09615 [Candidatus Dormibacteraeota bacterium]|nr:hypothetical protein [Candidatus Dormibacteraeota bacterium]
MRRAYVTARRPADVAREIESLAGTGCRDFVLQRVDSGGTLDLERLGAARYAAGLQSVVVLEAASAPEPSPVTEAAAR